MATYGSIPGVKISTSTGTISGVTIGRSQYLLLVGVGSTEATVATNEPVQIGGRNDVDEKFGADSDVANAYRRALSNGADPQFIRGVRVETTEQSESFTSTSGSLSNSPIVQDPTRISAVDDTNTSGDGDYEVTFGYADPVDPPTDSGIVNPYTGGFESTFAESTVTYETADWDSAFAACQGALSEGEFGVINPLTTSSEAGTALQSVISSMREDMKMVVGILGAEYNGTSTDGMPRLNPSEFTNTYSDDTMFLVGPTALENQDLGVQGVEALGAASGLFAGNSNTEPVYDSTLQGISSLDQDVSRADVTDLRNERVIPIRDTGVPRLEDNRSTYDQKTDGGWERDYFRRRIVDLTTVTLYLVARQQIGGILDGETVSDVQDAVNVEMSELVQDGLLEPGGQSVSVYRDDDRTIGMDIVISPFGVAKGADISLQINA